MPPPRRHFALTIAAYVGFLVLFAILLAGMAYWYLIPALDAYNSTDEPHRKLLAAHAMLMMILFLAILACFGALIFRYSRFFQPRATLPRSKTEYTDAWAEAGKRVQEEEDEDDDDEPTET